jgi:hypothetical protein
MHELHQVQGCAIVTKICQGLLGKLSSVNFFYQDVVIISKK